MNSELCTLLSVNAVQRHTQRVRFRVSSELPGIQILTQYDHQLGPYMVPYRPAAAK